MYRSKYFTLWEMTFSGTAMKYKIDNTPGPEELEHLQELMVVLDDIREKWGGPIRVSSGYRCPKVNTLVGGSKTSAHMRGYAADIKPCNNQMKEFVAFMKEWAKDKDFDQLLEERDNQGGWWIHLGLYNNANKQRKQIKTLFIKN